MCYLYLFYLFCWVTTCLQFPFFPQNGVVQGRVFQPHEAHVPFVLQFLMDHNLHGMNMIHLSSCRFRQPTGEAAWLMVFPFAQSSHDSHLSHTATLHSNLYLYWVVCLIVRGGRNDCHLATTVDTCQSFIGKTDLSIVR